MVATWQSPLSIFDAPLYIEVQDQLKNLEIPFLIPTVYLTRKVIDVFVIYLSHFQTVVETQEPSEIPIRQVMELYEYKLATLAHSERSALSSIEAASERCVHLQHRLVQLTTEHNKLRQVTYQTESRLEKTNETLDETKRLYLEVKHQHDCEIGKNNLLIT